MCHHSKLSLLLQLAVGIAGNVHTRNFSECMTWSSLCFSVVCRGCLLCGKKAESLPIHITNASLSNDISSSWNLASNHIQIGLQAAGCAMMSTQCPLH